MATPECENDLDCGSGNLICFGPEEPWNTEFNVSFCDCMHDEGWTRASRQEIRCRGFGVQTYYHIAIDSLIIFITATTLAYAAYKTCKYRAALKGHPVQVVTFLYCLVALIGFFAWKLVHLVSVTNPDLPAELIQRTTTRKPSGHYAQLVILFIACATTMFAYLNVSLVWMQLLKKLDMFNSYNSQVYMCVEKLPSYLTYKVAVYTIQAISVVICIVAGVFASSILIAIAFLFPSTIAVVMYWRGLSVLRRVLNSDRIRSLGPQNKQLQYKDFAAAIQETSLVVLISLLGILAGLLVFGLLYSPVNNTSPGTVSWVYIGRDFAAISCLVGLIAIVRYICFLWKFATAGTQSGTDVNVVKVQAREAESLAVSL